MANAVYETKTITATNQAVTDRDERGRFTIGNTPKTGFHTAPERRHDGRWQKDTSITYWYNKFGRMSDSQIEEFKKDSLGLTQFQKIALLRLDRATRDDDSSLAETKEITDRTEGKAKQEIDIEMDEKAPPIIRGFVIPTCPEGYIDEQIAKARANNSHRYV
jgi:hypothetical protein